jgi:uridylate kinase
MKKRVIVISLGGSLIIPDEINVSFLKNFKKTILKNSRKYKFIIVCGGGSTARKYISVLEDKSLNEKALAGIRATRANAKLMMQFFGKIANDKLPLSMKDVKDNLRKNKFVICGALRFAPKSTTDGTAAKLAGYLGTNFINITNVDGLYTSNPKTNKSARFIPEISWKDFYEIAKKIKFRAGQHFVLDQKAATLIKKKKIKTYIIGKNLRNLDNVLNGKKFKGTIISG